MKHSIKKQMIVIFISLLAFMCVAVLVCNVWLLGPYYIRNKEAKFISMYEALLDAEQNDELDTSDEETYSELVRLAEKNNLFFLAVNLKDQKLITNVQHTMDLQQNLDAFMLNRTEKNDRTLKKTDEYELTEILMPNTPVVVTMRSVCWVRTLIGCQRSWNVQSQI